MIRPVGGENPYSPSYDRNGKHSGRQEDSAPAFLLDHEEEGVIWERGDATGKKRQPDALSRQRTTRRSAEHSPKAEEKHFAGGLDSFEKSEEQKQRERLAAASDDEVTEEEKKLLGENIREFFNKLKEGIAGLIRSVWYGNEAAGKEAAEKEDAPGAPDSFINTGNEAEGLTPEEAADREIRRRIAAKDERGVMEVLTEGGRKKAARCTNLLTYYDRRGNVVDLDNINTGRILRGDTERGKYRKYL